MQTDTRTASQQNFRSLKETFEFTVKTTLDFYSNCKSHRFHSVERLSETPLQQKVFVPEK